GAGPFAQQKGDYEEPADDEKQIDAQETPVEQAQRSVRRSRVVPDHRQNAQGSQPIKRAKYCCFTELAVSAASKDVACHSTALFERDSAVSYGASSLREPSWRTTSTSPKREVVRNRHVM